MHSLCHLPGQLPRGCLTHLPRGTGINGAERRGGGIPPAMMALLCPPEELRLDAAPEETWPLFKQRFLLYLTATGAAQWPGEQQVALFLTVAGPAALDIFNTLRLKPGEEEDLTVVLAHFEERCLPRHSETYRRYLFHSRLQGPQEPVEAFAAELEHQSHACGFGPLRESLVRDQLVLGCRDEAARARLLQEYGLSLARAVQICQEAEEACDLGEHLQRTRRASRKDPGFSERPQQPCPEGQRRDLLRTYV